MKKLFLGILFILIVYALLWIVKYLACKVGIGDLESCIWNLKEYWFPFPKCVCV